jgi:PAT family beta-lactamase induction signal transducer AmpG
MLFLGLSAGIPLLLIFSSLSLWLREAGVERAAVTFFSWAALGYSFKFVWAPLVDSLPLPWLTRGLGRRRAWMLVSQLGIIGAILWMASTDPAGGELTLTSMALGAVLLGFSSATQDIVIDAYRIESAQAELQALLSSTYIAGYRIGMLVAGAGALFLASYFGSEKGSYSYQAWMYTYYIMAAAMLIGIATTLIIEEPRQTSGFGHGDAVRDYVGFLALFVVAAAVFVGTFALVGTVLQGWVGRVAQVAGNTVLAGVLVEALRLLAAALAAALVCRLVLATGWVNRAMVVETYVEPVREFFRRYGGKVALLLLALVGLYRISDIVLGVISNVFYQDLDFTKAQIATVVKSFGLAMTILGGFLGGVLSVRYGVMRILFVGALLTVLTNLLFILLAVVGNDELLLYVVISADNLTAGLASAAFIAFLSSLTNVRFTAVQYAIFSSLMTLLPKVIGGYSGTMVDSLGYVNFFILAAALGVPVLLLVWAAGKHLQLSPPQATAETSTE